MFVLDIIGIENGNNPHIHGVNLKYDCNVGCSCDNNRFDPVCLEGKNYFSACHAGCHNKVR